MAQFRPAGFSDEDSDSDDYGFYEKPARQYKPQITQHSIRKKIEVNIQDAIINGNVKEVEKIVLSDLNKNVNSKLDSSWTPLMHACFHAQEKIVELLLEKGADPNLHSDSVTPIMVTCSNSSANNDTVFNIISSLIEKGAILNIGDKYGQTPLMRATSSGRVDVVQKLLESEVNIEMRDQQGWTAVFWAAHHNQPEILEMLIIRGARLTEVDKSGRTPLEIAYSHDYQNIVEILETQLKPDDVQEKKTEFIPQKMTTWHDFYPGVDKGEKITYACDIPQLLYGMNVEHLYPNIQKAGLDLRSFLLLEEKDMEKLGIDMPFERQRLCRGLKNFHCKGWKLNAVAGLYVRKCNNYSVLDCVTTLGNHLHQIYILEASLQYTLREYKKIQQKLKFEPPGSPVVARLRTVAKNLLNNINCIRRETNNLISALTKISKNNPQPADYIKEKSLKDKAFGYFTEALMFCSMGVLIYHVKHYLTALNK